MKKTEPTVLRATQTQPNYGSVHNISTTKSQGILQEERSDFHFVLLLEQLAGPRHVSSIFKLLAVSMVLLGVWAMLGTESNRSPKHTVLVASPPATTPTPGVSVYCSTFQDPAECEEQRSIQAKYWTIQEVREQLWGTMEALAELEVRENQHYAEQLQTDKDETAMFDYFRRMMVGQVCVLALQNSTRNRA